MVESSRIKWKGSLWKGSLTPLLWIWLFTASDLTPSAGRWTSTVHVNAQSTPNPAYDQTTPNPAYESKKGTSLDPAFVKALQKMGKIPKKMIFSVSMSDKKCINEASLSNDF